MGTSAETRITAQAQAAEQNQTLDPSGSMQFTPLDEAGNRNFNRVQFEQIAGDGPLSALERVKNIQDKTLQYPIDLGSNISYPHTMRLLIYKQRNQSVKDIYSGTNPYDRSKVASIGNRYNSDVTGPVNAAFAAQVATSATTVLTAGVAAKAGAVGGLLFDAAKDLAKSTVGALKDLATGGAGVALAGYLSDTSNSAAYATYKEPLAYINLYMPEGLNFTDRQDYDAISVTDALGIAGTIQSKNPREILGRIGENFNFAGVKLLGQNATELALYNAGYALNPQLEILYKGTKNREFVFTFKFAPKNPEESSQVINIIRTLRYHAAPNFDTGGNEEATSGSRGSRYIIPPSQFEIEFLRVNSGAAVYNDSLPRIAPSVLTNVDVNYAPSGNYNTFYDGVPTIIQLQLTFTETVVLTKSDIEAGY